MFKEYQSRPVMRMARQITEKDKIDFDAETRKAVVTREADGKEFKVNTSSRPVAGDYLVFQNEARVNYVPKEQFEEENII